MVGHEHHPGGAVQTCFGEGVQQSADSCVGDGDGAVELGEVLSDVRCVGQVIGNSHARGVAGFVAFTRIGPVRLEEPGGQKETVGQAVR